jgi:molybdate transport system ATP-binding protein
LPDSVLSFEARYDMGTRPLEARFEARAGETFVLVGPSGAGKSTCLELAAGLLTPDAGRITCGGEVWCDTESGVHVPPHRRAVGIVFQEFALFPHLSVGGNVAYGARARGRADADARARRWLDTLGLSGHADRSVASLSGGERQRVALARALASEPAALLLDEPFGSLDVGTGAHVRGHLRSFLREVGLPTVLVTHDPLDALAFGDRLAVLEDGRLTQTGTRDDLLRRPRTPFVAELTGLNLYQAELAAGSGLREARVGPVVFHVLAGERQGTALLAFPPRDVTLARERLLGSSQNGFPGVVRTLLPLADRLRVILDVGVPLAADVTREGAAGLGLSEGSPVWAAVKATAIEVYG